jgi:hypothetical protein
MSEVIDAIKVWQEQNAPTIKGLDVAKQNAISQALNFFNKKFGGEGELMPIIEEKVIIETPKEKKKGKGANGLIKIKEIGIKINNDNLQFKDFQDAQVYLMDYFLHQVNRAPFRFDIYLTWEDGSNIISKFLIDANDTMLISYKPMKIPLNKYIYAYYLTGLDAVNGKAVNTNFYENNNSSYKEWDWQIDEPQEGFNVGDRVILNQDYNYSGVVLSKGQIGVVKSNWGGNLGKVQIQFDGDDINTVKTVYDTYLDKYVEPTPTSVENAINQQIMIPQMTQFELMSDVGSKLKKGDTGVFAEDYIPPNTFLDAYMNSEARPDVIYKIPFKKIRIIEELPLDEIKQAEEEVLFTDLEELENEIESINFEELEELDKELDDLF